MSQKYLKSQGNALKKKFYGVMLNAQLSSTVK